MADEFSDIRAAILTRINAVTGTTFSGVEISWPGQDASVDSVNVALHIAVEFSNRRRAALGAAAGSRIDGRAELTVLARADATAQPGTDEMEGYVDDVAALFPSALNIPAGAHTLRFREPVAGGTQQFSGGGATWIGRRVNCPFYLFT